MSVFQNLFGTVEDIAEEYCIDVSEFDGAEILLASYTYESWSGSSIVIFRKDGKLYENHGSHCSCYGLEDQWSPEETTIEAIEHTMTHGWVFSEFRTELQNVLDRLKEERNGPSVDVQVDDNDWLALGKTLH